MFCRTIPNPEGRVGNRWMKTTRRAIAYLLLDNRNSSYLFGHLLSNNTKQTAK
ncbi:MAG: hypothetical protein LBU34_09680 [Planctomycetaceae bacterium]|nr:hypothetical protein [Planctomycetaceae bacterium]